MAIVKIKTAKRNIKGIIDYVTNSEKTMENFETYLNDFLYDLKSETLNSLLEENDECNELYDEVDKLLDSITTEYPELFEKIDELVSKIAELESFESVYLYKQGYKDCFRLLKLLDT